MLSKKSWCAIWVLLAACKSSGADNAMDGGVSAQDASHASFDMSIADANVLVDATSMDAAFVTDMNQADVPPLFPDTGTPFDGSFSFDMTFISPDAATDAGASTTCVNAFTAPLIDFDSLRDVTQIGGVGGGGTEIVGRSYIFPKPTLADMELPIYAPTNMRLIGGVRYLPPGASLDDGYVPDWALAFVPDCSSNVLIELYHIKTVVPVLEEAIGTTIAMSSAWNSISPPIHFNAGDRIGGYIPGTHSVAFDFIVRDGDVVNTFANQERYETARSNLLNIICPYTYFTPTLRAQYDELFGAPGTDPIDGATCGSVEVDVVGSIAGQWFLDPDPSSGLGGLSTMDGYGNPHPIAMNADNSITFGNVGPSISGFRVYQDDPSWKRPSEVTGEHCYQLSNLGSPDGYLFYKNISDSEMKLVYSATGMCPGTFPSSGGRSYYR